MSVLGTEEIHAITESVGLSVKESVASALLSDVEYRMREIIFEAKKFMRHSKRSRLLAEDINHALKVKNVEPLYGFSATSSYRFKHIQHGNQRLYYLDDKEIDLDDVIGAPLPPVPLEVTYTAHWLAIEGVQPAIVQNPSPADAKAAADAGQLHQQRAVAAQRSEPTISASSGMLNGELLVKNVLSKELQLYYDKITESFISKHVDICNLAIESVTKDPGIQPLLPYFVQFISEKITKNVRNLHVLWAMMRMTRGLLDNKNLFIEPYLHQIIPGILTCLVSKRIGELGDDHFSLRTFASQLAAHVCATFGVTYPTVQPRITKTLLRAFLDSEKSMSTHFGALRGLAALGPETVQLVIVPNVRTFGEKLLAPVMDASGGFKDEEARRCHGAIIEILVTYVQNENTGERGNERPFSTESYKDLFGMFADEVFSKLN